MNDHKGMSNEIRAGKFGLAGDPVMKVGFVVKRYPRYSETFVVREILAHEQTGLPIEIFALRPPNDGHFQDLISRVRARVNYVYMPSEGKVSEEITGAALPMAHFWSALAEASDVLPGLWEALAHAKNVEARHVYQAVVLARQVKLKGVGHLHAPFASDAATVARLAALFAGISYSFTARAKDIFHETVRPDDLRRKLRDASGVVTISDFHLDYLRRTFGTSAARVERIYNGLDLEEFGYRAPQDRPPTILAVGRLVEKKGFSDLIEACGILSERGRHFRCRIVGNGSLRERLQSHIDDLQLGSYVELTGPRPQAEIIGEMRNAALLAAPCVIAADGDRDGLPNVIQEALALGTPVVSTDVTGIAEVIRNGITGLQVPQYDPPALADAMELLLADPVLRVRLATGGRRLIEAEFDIRRNTMRRRAIFFRSNWNQQTRVPVEAVG